MKTDIKNNPHAEVVLTGTLLVDDIQKHFGPAVEEAITEADLPGFRKGKAPKERVIEAYGERSLWRMAAEDALRGQLADILKEHSIIPFLAPSILLNVGTHNADVPFEVVVIKRPSAKIEEYGSIAKKAIAALEPLKLDEEKQKARQALDAQARAMVGKADTSDFTDDDVQKIGMENVAALSLFLDQESERAVAGHDDQRKRSSVAEALLKSATCDIPLVLIEDELVGMLEQTKREVSEQGMPWNEYLKAANKAEEAIKLELKPHAEKRVALDLVFATIAEKEKLSPDDAEVHKLAHVLQAQGVPSDRAHSYAAEVSIRERIWNVLGVTTPKPKEEKVEPGSHDHSDPNHTH